MRADCTPAAISAAPLTPRPEPSQPAADQKADNHEQAPDRKEKQGQDTGVLGARFAAAI